MDGSWGKETTLRFSIDKVPLTLIVAVALSGCASLRPAPRTPRETDPLEVRLARAESLWAGQGISSYLLEVRMTCFCPALPAYQVTVRDGNIVKVHRVEGDGALLEVPPDEGPALTVDQLFELARTGAPPRQAAFHEAMGYPVEVLLGDWSLDEGVGYRVLSLTPLR